MAEPATFPRTDRTTPTRHADRADWEVAAAYAVIDEALICHVGYVVDGEPVVIPTIHTRVGDVLYLHSSSGARLARAARAESVPVCVTVTLLDGIVFARSHFNHSMNYRSVVIRGHATGVTDEAEREAAFAAVVEHVAAGRAATSRPPTRKELAATSVLRVPIVDAVLKARTGGVGDGPEDAGLPHWAGVLPVSTAYGTPVDAGDLAPGIAAPAYVTGYERPRAVTPGVRAAEER